MNRFDISPGVMIDPVTMNPIVRGGSITVNPMGMPVPVEQKPWLKFALMNIHEDMPDDLIKRLVGSLGKVVSFNRIQYQKTKIKANYCIFQYSCGEDVVRACKFFKDVKIIDRLLDLKISEDTKNFLRQWMTIQKQQWKKKLNATGMNEAKQYQSLEAFLERDDKTIQDRFNNALRDVNNEFKRVLQSKQKDDQRKEHIREKERDKKKRQLKDQLEKKYVQKVEYWLTREREKEREYKKESERERDRERMKVRKLEREMDMDEEEEKKKIAKFLSSDRRRLREKELETDLQKIELEWLPPEPELLGEVLAPEGPAPEEVIAEMEQRKQHTFTVQEEELQPTANNQVQDLIQLDDSEAKKKQKIIAPKVDKVYKESKVVEKEKPITLNLPSLPDLQQKRVDPAKEEQRKRKEQELFKLYKQIPRNKQGLWSYKIDWAVFNQGNIFDRKIRPWLFKTCTKLFGEVQEKFISIIEKFFVKKGSPDQLVQMLHGVLDTETEKFVMDLWTETIFSILKIINEIQEL